MSKSNGVDPFCDREHLTDGCVAMVNYIVANGNTTTYQWRTNEVPCRIEEVKLDYLNDDVKGENDEADEVGLLVIHCIFVSSTAPKLCYLL